MCKDLNTIIGITAGMLYVLGIVYFLVRITIISLKKPSKKDKERIEKARRQFPTRRVL